MIPSLLKTMKPVRISGINDNPEGPEIPQDLRKGHKDKASYHSAHKGPATPHNHGGNGNDGKIKGKERKTGEHIQMGDIGAGKASHERCDKHRYGLHICHIYA